MPLEDGTFADHISGHGVLLERSPRPVFGCVDRSASTKSRLGATAVRFRQPSAGCGRKRYLRTARCSFMLPLADLTNARLPRADDCCMCSGVVGSRPTVVLTGTGIEPVTPEFHSGALSN